ncbi:hypothetical protein H6F61_04815 [Cyanobacteria bacterium FACHB-472]|nr:hypothetical protein [Cyanobacteria bacterium FACHB-472]
MDALTIINENYIKYSDFAVKSLPRWLERIGIFTPKENRDRISNTREQALTRVFIRHDCWRSLRGVRLVQGEQTLIRASREARTRSRSISVMGK